MDRSGDGRTRRCQRRTVDTTKVPRTATRSAVRENGDGMLVGSGWSAGSWAEAEVAEMLLRPHVPVRPPPRPITCIIHTLLRGYQYFRLYCML